MKLLLRAFVKLLSGMAAISLLLFLPAGTYLYPNGLFFCVLLFVPMLIVGTILFIEGARSRPSQPQKADTLCRFRRGLRGD